jgi:hypothetical protein
VLVTGSGKITVVMWPLVVDTVFSAGSLAAAPVLTAGKSGAVTLLPANWDVTWTIKRGTSGNGFTDLIRAQKLITANGTGDSLKVRSKQTIVRGTGLDSSTQRAVDTETGNVITRSLGNYTSGFGCIGKPGSVSFRLEYVPFNLAGADAWSMVAGPALDLSGRGPVRIIRNGVNDEEQKDATDFTAFRNIGNPGRRTVNGNGTVRDKPPRPPLMRGAPWR